MIGLFRFTMTTITVPVSSIPGAKTPLHVLNRGHLKVLLHVVQAVLGHVGDPKVVVRPNLREKKEQKCQI